jgi:hypothetical protein
MNLKKVTLFIVALLIICVGSSFSQVHFNALLLTPDIKTFFLKDLTSATSTIDIFRIELINNSGVPQPCILEIKIEKGEAKELIGQGETESFSLLPTGVIPAPGSGGITSPAIITNTNLFSDLESYFSIKGGFNITSVGNELQNFILSTGRLPSDLYLFTLKLITTSPVTPMDEHVLQLDLRTKGTASVTLLSPGSEEFNPALEISTIFPNFQWDSGLDKFKLIVGERLDTMPGIADLDPEEILTTRTVIDKTLQKPDETGAVDPGAERIDGNSYQYTGALLQFGRTYYYQIIGLQATSSGGGEEEIPSEIWAFKIKDIAGELAGGVSTEILLNSLAMIPGLDLALSGLFEEGGELYGLSPGTITIGGSNVTFAELAAYLAKLKNDGKSSFNIVIEDTPE